MGYGYNGYHIIISVGSKVISVGRKVISVGRKVITQENEISEDRESVNGNGFPDVSRTRNFVLAERSSR